MNAPRDPWGSGTPEASGGDLLPSLAPGMSGGSEATDHPVFDGSEAGRYAQTTLLGRGSMGRVVGALDLERVGRRGRKEDVDKPVHHGSGAVGLVRQPLLPAHRVVQPGGALDRHLRLVKDV